MRSVCLTFLITIAFLLEAQNYIPLPTDTGTVWRSIQTDINYCSETQYQIVGDTIINSTTFQKIMITSVQRNPGSICRGVISISPDTTNVYLRNDSLNRKVYLRTLNLNKDTLLYDFDLAIGDTLQPTYITRSYDTIVIDTIRIDTIAGQQRRVFVTSLSRNCQTNFEFIEGIGSNKGLLQPFTCFISPAYYLNCMSINGKTIYPDSTTSCDLITSLEDIGTKKVIQLLPNPTTGVFNIPENENLNFIQLYNIQGQMVTSVRPQSNAPTNLHIEGAHGMYFVQLQFKDGTIESRKIIKQ